LAGRPSALRSGLRYRGGQAMTVMTALMRETILWRLGEVDGELHTLKEASDRSGISIQHIALAERIPTKKEDIYE